MSVLEYKRALALEDESRRRRRERERAAEIERLERAEREEREAKPVVPVVQSLNRQVLPWCIPLQRHARYKGASGGRGSGKSWFFAEEAVEQMVKNSALRVACIREVQRSLRLSVKSLVEDRIRAFGVSEQFEILNTEIRRVDGTGLMIFEGMQDHTAASIKSLEAFGIAWFEEADRMSQRSMDLLEPTIRLPGSQLWFSWNPEQPTDPVDQLFAELKTDTHETSVHVHTTYRDNPLITQELLNLAARHKANDPDGYEHIWGGGYNLGGKGRVYSSFVNREFPDGNLDESIEDIGGELVVGMDFNVNPMSAVVAVRAGDQCLVIDALEIDTSNTEEMAAELRVRYPAIPDRWGIPVPRRIIVCPDPSGRQRRSSAPVGQTDFTILERYGFEVRAPSGPPAVPDRINNTQQMFFNAETQRRRIRIHPSAAKPLVTALANHTYKEGTSQPNKNSGFDHITDALGYLLWQEFPVAVPQAQAWGQSTNGLYKSSNR